MLQNNQLELNRKMKYEFLQLRPIRKEFKLHDDEIPYGYIYCIENKKSGRKYIGSTYSIYVGIKRPSPEAPLLKRASMYIYEYNRALEGKPRNSTAKTIRPVILAMVRDGIDNYVMYPLAETTKANHTNMENYFIEYYDAIDCGYNAGRAGSTYQFKRRAQSIKDKQIRSERICCVNINQNKIMECESMKLFADYMKSSKDMIKNVTRIGRPYKGWFIFYNNKEKRDFILKNCVLNHNTNYATTHSEESKNFYQSLCNSVEQYLTNEKGYEYFPGFERLPDLVYTE